MTLSRIVGANDRIADAVESDLGAFFFSEQRFFHSLAFDGVAQRAKKCARLKLAFNQVILGAFAQYLFGQRLVIQTGQDRQGDMRSRRSDAAQSSDALGIRQAEIEKDNVITFLSQTALGLAHTFRASQLSGDGTAPAQHRAEQKGVVVVVLDQQYFDWGVGHSGGLAADCRRTPHVTQ